MKVSCAICQKEMSYINNRHLATHALTAEEYKQRFPNSLMKSDEVTQKLVDRSIKANEKRKGVKRTPQELEAMRLGIKKAAQLHGPRIPYNKNVSMSDEQKKKISETKKQKYAEGYVSPAKGRVVSQETREKISNLLSGKKLSKEVIEKARSTFRKNQKSGLHKSRKGRIVSDSTKQKMSQATKTRFVNLRAEIRQPMLERINEAYLILKNDIVSNYFELECKICGYNFTRTPQNFHPAKFKKEICKQCFPVEKTSSAERTIADFIEQYVKIVRSDWETIPPLEIDIFIPSLNIGIEYCGLYWHSELAGKHRHYHKLKMDSCFEKGIQLITIFEDEWENKQELVKAMLLNKILGGKKIPARKCKIVKLDAATANVFVEKNHLQGRGRANVYYGLKYDEDLISVMSFSNNEISRHGKNWDINRFCSLAGYQVIGGASKLFNQFVKEYNPEFVVSYADLRWGTGNVYQNLGFKKIGNTVPNYWYFREGILRRYHRYGLRKTENDPKDQTEWKTRQQEGWNRIWDCGHAKWVWNQPILNLD